MKKRPDFSGSPGAALISLLAKLHQHGRDFGARADLLRREGGGDVPVITPVLTAQAMASRAQPDTLAWS